MTQNLKLDNIINFHPNELIIKKLQSDKLNLDHMFILRCLYNNESSLLNIYTDNLSNEKALNYINTLERKRLVFFDSSLLTMIITQDGIEYYNNLYSLSTGKTINNNTSVKKIRQEGFEEWWSLYPSNSKWQDPTTGQKFTEIRPLKTAKEQCKKKYDALINLNKITHNDLISCLKYEIKARKIDSLKTGKNQLCFMKNSLSYLNQEAYCAYMEEAKECPEYVTEYTDNLNISSDDIYNSNNELGN